LVFDKDHNGIAGENGSECFGDNTDLDGDGKADGYKDGFEALKALAAKEGLTNGVDDNKLDINDLKILEEKYGLGIKIEGYNDSVSSLADAGITEINLATTSETTLEDDFDGNGNQLMHQEGATFTVNGQTREYADIWHKKQDLSSNTTSKSTNSTSEYNENGLSDKNLEAINKIEEASMNFSALTFNINQLEVRSDDIIKEANSSLVNFKKSLTGTQLSNLKRTFGISIAKKTQEIKKAEEAQKAQEKAEAAKEAQEKEEIKKEKEKEKEKEEK